MDISKPIETIAQRIAEHDAGYTKEYYDNRTGQTHIVNELDVKSGQIYRAAKQQEEAERVQEHMVTVTVLTLIIIVVLLVMLIIYINMSADMTGIYYDKSGNKIEVHHNKTLGNVKFYYKDNGKDEVHKTGYLKKINDRYYGLYLDEDAVLGKYSLAGYADAREKSWSWKDNKWIME
jgi:hypothetical protein